MHLDVDARFQRVIMCVSPTPVVITALNCILTMTAELNDTWARVHTLIDTFLFIDQSPMHSTVMCWSIDDMFYEKMPLIININLRQQLCVVMLMRFSMGYILFCGRWTSAFPRSWTLKSSHAFHPVLLHTTANFIPNIFPIDIFCSDFKGGVFKKYFRVSLNFFTKWSHKNYFLKPNIFYKKFKFTKKLGFLSIDLSIENFSHKINFSINFPNFSEASLYLQNRDRACWFV